MIFLLRGPGAFCSTLFITLLIQCRTVVAQNATEALPNFGDTVQILGAMERTDQDFQDGLALDLFSPTNRTLTVQQNMQPLAAQFVSGTTGESFVALQNFSYIIKMNETANDLIAKIEIPYDPNMLATMGIDQSNTYVGTLAADKKSWVINDATRNVHVSENNTRIIKMTSLDGEYMLLGRKSLDTTNIFVQYGQGATRTVNMTGGPGIQEAEFIDGLRFSTQADTELKMNVDIIQGIKPETLPASMKSLNSFAWVVNTSDSNVKVVSQMRVPFNTAMLAALNGNSSKASYMLTVGKRALNATAEAYASIAQNQQAIQVQESRIVVSGLTQLDGQYIMMVMPTA